MYCSISMAYTERFEGYTDFGNQSNLSPCFYFEGATTYTCMLNQHGGVAADLTVSVLEEGDNSNAMQPKDGGFYLAVGGAIGQHAWGHIQDILHHKKFDCTLTDRSEDVGMLSVQGPKR